MVAVGGVHGSVQLISLRDGTVEARLDGFERDVQSLCWRRLSLPSPQHADDANRSDDGSWQPTAEASPSAPPEPLGEAAISEAADRKATLAAESGPPPPPPPEPHGSAVSESLGGSACGAPPWDAVTASAVDPARVDAPTASRWRDVLVAGSRDALLRLWVTGCVLGLELLF